MRAHVLIALVLMRLPMMMVLVIMLIPFFQGRNTEQFVDGAEARETGRQEDNGKNAEDHCRYSAQFTSQIQDSHHDSKKRPQYPVDHSHVLLHNKHLPLAQAGPSAYDDDKAAGQACYSCLMVHPAGVNRQVFPFGIHQNLTTDEHG